MAYFFSSESVSEGHPDKMADQISDGILDNFLAFDKDARVACETLLTTGQVILAGEVKSKTIVDVRRVARKVIHDIGYTQHSLGFDSHSCGILTALHGQSVDISRGVEPGFTKAQGAGDQGIMFGYATTETEEYMPATLILAHKILKVLAEIRKEGVQMTYLRPDAKSQVCMAYDDQGEPEYVHSIVLSTQHDEFLSSDEQMICQITEDVKAILLPRLIASCGERLAQVLQRSKDIQLHINPTGRFVIGGPHGDAGLTGRKIIVDTYGGRAPHGGGAFSGKDSSKVDRSAAYATRYIAKNIVHAGIAKRVLIQLAYMIGHADPIAIYVNTEGTAKPGISDNDIARAVQEIFELTPSGIEKMLNLRAPIYLPTASYGHFGREMQKGVTRVFHGIDGTPKTVVVDLFTWENLDKAADLRSFLKL